VFEGTEWEGLHPHAFRRPVATRLDAKGFSAREIADYLGWLLSLSLVLIGTLGGKPTAEAVTSQILGVVLADHLADIHAVLRGERRVRTQGVLRRLAEHNPAEYEDWSFQDLAEALAAHGITARKSDGVMVVRASDVVARSRRT